MESSNNQIIAQLYEETREQLFLIFRQAGISEEECWDKVQDVFIRLLNVDLLVPALAKGLAVTVAYNMRTDYLRHLYFVRESQKSHPELFMEGVSSNHFEAKELEELELRAVSSLSEQDAQIYVLTRFDGKTPEEICSMTSLTKRAVESRLYRSRMHVRERLRKAVGF